MASGPIYLGLPRRAVLVSRLKKKRCPARGAARSTQRSTTGKIMSCCSRMRLTTPAHCKRNGAGSFRVSHSLVLASCFLLPASSFRVPSMATFISNSGAETIAFARKWAESLAPNDVVALVGDLGGGETHFLKGLVQGPASAHEATSPAFPPLHEYRKGRLPVFHFDFFRLKQQSEIDEIGFDEYLDEGGVVVIEWADRFPQALPAGTRWLRIEAVSEVKRAITEEKQ